MGIAVSLCLSVFMLSLCVLVLCISAFFGVLVFKSLGFQIKDRKRLEAEKEHEAAEIARAERSMAGKIIGGR